jgi:hypothetical protein
MPKLMGNGNNVSPLNTVVSRTIESLETYRQAHARKDGMAKRVITKDF